MVIRLHQQDDTDNSEWMDLVMIMLAIKTVLFRTMID